MDVLRQDVRYGIRSLLKSPGFTLIAVLTVALGIGASTAMFSAFYSVLLKPLPYASPDQLYLVWEDASAYDSPKDTPAPANYFDWREQSHSFADMAALSTDLVNFAGHGEPEQLGGAAVTANFFSLMGVSSKLGRAFVAGEDQEGAQRVVVLSHRLWQRRFGGDPAVLGRAIQLDGRSFNVVGVVPASFTFPAPVIDVWVPFEWNAELRNNRGDHFLYVVGRLRPGISPLAAQSEMTAIAARLEKAYPQTNAKLGVNLEALRDYYAGDVRPAMLALMAAVGLVLLVACINVANLLLARSSRRRNELFVRAALGAGPQQLVRLVLVESLLVAGVGAVFGIALAAGAIRVFAALLPARLGEAGQAEVSLPVLIFAVALASAASILFGIVPAWRASRVTLAQGLGQSSRSVAGGGSRLRRSLVVGEVAVSICLLIGAGLMLQTLVALANAPLGFNPQGAMTVLTPLGGEKYRPHEARVRFFQQVLDKVRTLPSVMAAGYSSQIPLTFGGDQNSFQIEGRPVPPPGQQDIGPVRVITPGYFQAVGTPVLSGRSFDEHDTPDSERVVMVNQTFARRFWPGQDAVGKRIQRGSRIVEGAWLRVVGVVQDAPQVSIERGAKIEIFVPYTQFRGYYFVPKRLVVRAAGDPLLLAGAVRDAVHAADMDQPVSQAVTLESVVGDALAQRRLQASLFVGFAGIALLLAVVGLFGVLSQLVTQRMREFGIRIALGAKARDVLGMVVRHALVLVLTGAALGILGYLALARFLVILLYQVSGTDPWTIVGVTALLTMVALLACVLPAWRAARVDPSIVLRYE